MPSSFRTLLNADVGSAREPVSAREVVAGLDFAGLQSAAGTTTHPYLVLNMVSTLDGRASIHGRSGPIGNRADQELFHALRTVVDGVMVGAQTLRIERYNRIVDSEVLREERERRGLEREPWACVVSESLALPPQITLLADPSARVVILTPSEGHIPTGAKARVEYVRASREGHLDLSAALVQLRERFGLRTLLCEGGPHLNCQLFAAGVVNELFLTLAPTLAGEDPLREALRIISGVSLDPPVSLELLSVFENEGNLFLRYRVCQRTQAGD